MSAQNKNKAPSVQYTRDGSIKVRHREYIGDIVVSTQNFSVSKYAINPGIGTTFIWLQAIAQSYESYIFNSLSFEFESSCATTDRGTIMLGIDFDASDEPPLSKQELMSYEGSVRSSVWSHCSCRATPQNLKKFGVQRYIRTLVQPQGSDIKTFDVGNFYIATQGSASITLGELYVAYDVTFYTPQPGIRNIVGSYSARFTTNGTTAASPVGNSINITGAPIVRFRSSNSVDILQVGSYLVTVSFNGTGLEEGEFSLVLVGTGVYTPAPGPTILPGGNLGRDSIIIDVRGAAWLQFAVAQNQTTFLSSLDVRIAPYPYQYG